MNIFQISRVHFSHMDSSNPGGYTKTHERIRWASGEKVDLRLLVLLESLEEIYVKRQELFKKIFPGDHHQLFQKIGDAKTTKNKQKKKSMRRSQSIGPGYAVKGRGLDINGIDEFKVERFKVRTPIVMEEDGQGGTTLGGSTNDSK
ncbi:hypothetical protein F511_06771 [Dorcoceras hygrometricum]|uniref:Uncharacterized protein n=1 Tax=Dorcoceras hygrometricum TaxID=472368 RepID=A0A2Z7D6P0_9LAMI|nr:hypothetical protein F511_06771 [Dorcoceras hygrometricum]